MGDELDEGLPQFLGERQPGAHDVRQREEREEQADPEDLEKKRKLVNAQCRLDENGNWVGFLLQCIPDVRSIARTEKLTF